VNEKERTKVLYSGRWWREAGLIRLCLYSLLP
jgi:hypothetical protein